MYMLTSMEKRSAACAIAVLPLTCRNCTKPEDFRISDAPRRSARRDRRVPLDRQPGSASRFSNRISSPSCHSNRLLTSIHNNPFRHRESCPRGRYPPYSKPTPFLYFVVFLRQIYSQYFFNLTLITVICCFTLYCIWRTVHYIRPTWNVPAILYTAAESQ